MKKSKIIILVSFVLALISFSCGDDLERAFDCSTENLLLTIKHPADAANAKKINYELDYTGEYIVESVKWTFGDGQTQTVNGKTVSHTYTAAGTFSVKADVTLKKGSSSCTSAHSKSITVN